MPTTPDAATLTFRPTRPEFHAHAAEHTVVPVWTELLADLETPVAAYVKLVGDGPGFLLESVEGAERWARFSFVGRNPSATLLLRDGRVELDGPLPAGIPTDQGILAALESLLASYRSPAFEDLPPLHGGIMGYLGYDVIREVERLPDVPADDRGFPDAVMSVIGSLAAFDHWRQRVYLIESVPTLGLSSAALDAAYDAAVERVRKAVADLAQPLPYTPVEPPSADDVLPELTSSMPGGLYQKAVAVAKDYVVAGDIFQVVLAQRYDLDLGADPFDVYRVLRQVNPSPYMYFVRHPELTIVGSSPEPMVQLLDRTVVSRPIAGTRRRGKTDEHDRRMAAELSEHPKERAEHVMLVDLARNDVGRVAQFGTVHVDELMTLERYSHVMHLTSQVSGALRDGLGPIDVLRATLPAGTVSGAPKVRAMEIIDDLEPVKRGPYAGVVGYIDWSGDADLVIPTPESGTPAAIGYAQESGIPYGQGLVKNSYVGRTFIQPSQTIRQLGIRLKLNPLREVIAGKRLIVVDDSIVRGNTQRAIVRMLREAGATEVHVRISSPPVAWPCYYGIDFATRAELIAGSLSVEEIRASLEADSLGYISLEGLIEATTLPANRLCRACFDGSYPIPIDTDNVGKFLLEDVQEARV